MAYRLPYKRNSSTDMVWTPAELKRLNKQSNNHASDQVREYVGRPSVDENGKPITNEPTKKKSTTSTKEVDKRKHSKTSENSHSLHPPRHSKRSSHRRSSFNPSHQHRSSQVVGDSGSLLLDWHNTAPWRHMAGFNLEIWWRHSTSQQRMNAGILLLLFIIILMHVGLGVWLITKSFREKVRSPYLCETEDCHNAGVFISEFVNQSEDPCNNFYEFVCGNYHFEAESEGTYFDDELQAPAFSIELGEHSLLADILKDYRHDKHHDQSIEYYRNCLDDPIRQKFGLEALLETVEYAFGTRDFTKFEKGTLSLEEIGARMLEVVGHASFINVAFYTYPHIQIIRPSIFVTRLHFKDKFDPFDTAKPPQNNPLFVKRALQGILPLLGVQKGSKLMKEMVQGINMITQIVSVLEDNTKMVRMPKEPFNTGNKEYQAYLKMVQENLFDGNYCPPMGNVKLDMEKVLLLWLKEPDYKIEYLDLMALKYFHGLQLCFAHDPSSYTPGPSPPSKWKYKFTYPKTAFVAIWILELFWDYASAADTINLLDSWGLNETILVDQNYEVADKYGDAQDDSELRCLDSLWINLGYMPSIRYLLATHENPAEFINDVENHLYDVFHRMSDIFDRVPETEISSLWKYIGPKILGREMYIDFVLPLPGGILDKEDIEDDLPFTEDHLRNTLIAVKYTVERSRQFWLGATNTQPTAKWWGDGEPHEIREQLLDLKIPMVLSAPFKEQDQAATKELWETFLGYPHTNYVLFPLSMINEPHLTETLALHHAGSTVKQIRAFLRIASDPFLPDTYPSFTKWSDLLYVGDPTTDNQADRKCSALHHKFETPESELFQYIIKDDYHTFKFSWNYYPTFLNLLAVKEAFRTFREERANLMALPFNWTLPLELRHERTQKFLPGKITKKLSEEQLFFMAYVRHVCRGGWRTHDDDYKVERYWLEREVLTVLMQMEEFSQVWNCDKNSFMNNLGKDRCMRWVP